MEQRIPAFAKQLTAKDATMLTSLMHSWGINIRFLGLVRHRSALKEVKEAALMEMIARTLQKTLQERLRDEISRLRAPSMSPYLHLISDFFNMVTSDPWFWKRPRLLKSRLIKKFGLVCLSEEERESRVSLATLIHMPTLLSRLSYLAGIHLRSGPRVFAEEGLNEPFVTSDFAMVPRITEMDIASLALAEQYRKQAKSKLGTNKLTLLQSAAEIFSKAAISHPHNLTNRIRWLHVLISIVRHSVRNNADDEQIDSEFSRAETVLQECLQECDRKGEIPSEVLFLHSSLLRQKYHRIVNTSGGSASLLLKGLGYWCKSYQLLLESRQQPSLHVGLAVGSEPRFQHRKDKRWMELVMGLASLTDLREISGMSALLGPIVMQDISLARYMISMLKRGRTFARTFGVLFAVFRPYQNLMDLLKRHLNSESEVVVRHLTMEYLDDSIVAPILQLCTEKILSLDLSYCSGMTNDSMLMLARTPSLTSLSLRQCHRINDEGILSTIESFPQLKRLNLTGCARLTDRCFAKVRFQSLEVLVLKKCVRIEGEFLRNHHFAPTLRVLDLESCHGLLKHSILRITNDSFPKLEGLTLNHVGSVKGQMVGTLLKNCPTLCDFRLQNTGVSEKGFRGSNRHPVNIVRLNLHGTDVNDEVMGMLGQLDQLKRLKLKECSNITSYGVLSFARARSSKAADMTHLDMTDVPRVSDDAMHEILCNANKKGASEWISLKLRGCNLALMSLQCILASAKNLSSLSLSGRPELDISVPIVTVNIAKLYLETCSWAPSFFKILLSDELISLKLRSCPNLDNTAIKMVGQICKNLQKLNLFSLPVDENCYSPLTSLDYLQKVIFIFQLFKFFFPPFVVDPSRFTSQR